MRGQLPGSAEIRSPLGGQHHVSAARRRHQLEQLARCVGELGGERSREQLAIILHRLAAEFERVAEQGLIGHLAIVFGETCPEMSAGYHYPTVSVAIGPQRYAGEPDELLDDLGSPFRIEDIDMRSTISGYHDGGARVATPQVH